MRIFRETTSPRKLDVVIVRAEIDEYVSVGFWKFGMLRLHAWNQPLIVVSTARIACAANPLTPKNVEISDSQKPSANSNAQVPKLIVSVEKASVGGRSTLIAGGV